MEPTDVRSFLRNGVFLPDKSYDLADEYDRASLFASLAATLSQIAVAEDPTYGGTHVSRKVREELEIAILHLGLAADQERQETEESDRDRRLGI